MKVHANSRTAPRRAAAIVGWLLMGIAALLAACGPGTVDATLVAEHDALSTQIVDLRGTATVLFDQLALTSEFAGTSVARERRRNLELIATLQSVGLDPTALAQVSPQPLPQSTPTPLPQAQPGAITPVPVTNAAPPVGGDVIIPTATMGAPTVFNVMTAETVGENDCAIGQMSSFSSSAERIYVSATAANIPAGIVLGSQWFDAANTLLVSHDFTPDFEILDNCIWFYVDQTDFAFAPGNYAVQLTINGAAAGPLVPFTITG
ncbi:MAG: hypothetical protein JNM70_22950 [Anaerolineae bacterium]|nr:hypothetical protein [Anaerolineae bacterium]